MPDFSLFPGMTSGLFPSWWQDWTGATAVLVASGPSARDVRLDELEGKVKAIAVNDSWRLAPWSDVLYATDGKFWRVRGGVPEFKGLKLSSDASAAEEFGLGRVKCRKPDDRLLLDNPGEIGWGGNSGFHALNLAVQFGADKVILVGFDMTLRNGLHWHGAHGEGLHNPTPVNVERWRRAVDGAAKTLELVKVKVWNCAAGSALTRYPKATLEEALAA